MKKSDFAGWREVYSFTFSQTVKEKAYAICLVIFAVIALLNSTVTALFSQYGEMKDEKVVISEVVVFDETGLDIDYVNVFSSKKYKNVQINANPSLTLSEYEEQMKAKSDDKMLIQIKFDNEDEEYKMLFVQGKSVSLSELARIEFSDEFCEFFEEAVMKAEGISKEQRDFIQTSTEHEVIGLEQDGEIIEKSKSDTITFNDYFVMVIMLMICMMLINISANQVALSIVTEKSSRVIEYLIINVRPLALITGKLLATIVTSSLQMIAIGFCYMASPIISSIVTPKLSKLLFGVVESAQTGETMADEAMANSIKMIHNYKLEYVFFAVLFVVLGIVLFGIIAGLLGASVSKMDEMQEAMSMFQVLLVFGCYADLALCVLQMSEKANPILTKIICICPITAPFWVPGSMILGNMSWPLIIASFVVIIAAIVLLFILTASVYEAMIFYNGKALTVKDIISLASSKDRNIRKEETKDEK